MRLTYLALLATLCIAAFIEKTYATIDLSNVDLSKFQFFKDKVESQMMAKAQQAMMLLAPLQDKIEKAKAVGTYFKMVFFGHPERNTETKIYFDPEQGQKYRHSYERRYGPKGKYLIEALGKGYSPEQFQAYNAYYQYPGY